nr:mRNA cap guanine-N7 methyltransferase 1 [Tanacetum cinerariifolium]
MKRRYRQTSSSASLSPPKSKSRRNPDGDAFLEGGSRNNVSKKIADHYSARANRTLEEREASPIIHLKKLNNWIKSVLIQLYAKRGDAVLDLACGKGGDLIKWDKANIGYYVGIDEAEGSIEDCRTRYNGAAGPRYRKRFAFSARLYSGSCFDVRLDQALADDAPFDICSCQFAMHYAWSTEARARTALANVSSLLRPGGIFMGTMPDADVIVKRLRTADGFAYGNSIYRIQFDDEFPEEKFKSSSPFGIQYTFHLEDAIDCPEWIVPFQAFKSLAEEECLNGEFVRLGLTLKFDPVAGYHWFDADRPMSSKASKVRLDQALADDAPFDMCSCQVSTCTYDLSHLGGIFIGTMPDAVVIVKRLSTGNNMLTRSLSSMSDTKKYIISVTPDSKVFSITHIRRLSEPKKITSLNIRSAEPVSKPKLSDRGPETKKKCAIMSVDQSTLSLDEWEVAYLYLSYVFRKRGRPEQNRGNTRRNKGKMHLEKEDITHIS